LPFRDDPRHLRDIIESIDLIDDFVDTLDFEAYRNDIKTKSAVERQIQILTEAAKRLGEESRPRYLGVDWRSWCDMGNVIRHACHRVNDEIVWNTIKTDLPELRRSADKALHSIEPQLPEAAPE